MIGNGIQGLQIADLARVRVPATVVFGQHDSSVPVASGRRVAARAARADHDHPGRRATSRRSRTRAPSPP